MATVKDENKQLKEQNKDLCESLDIMNNRESELLDMIEKMKCCGNCLFSNGLGCMLSCNNYDLWELAE